MRPDNDDWFESFCSKITPCYVPNQFELSPCYSLFVCLPHVLTNNFNLIELQLAIFSRKSIASGLDNNKSYLSYYNIRSLSILMTRNTLFFSNDAQSKKKKNLQKFRQPKFQILIRYLTQKEIIYAELQTKSTLRIYFKFYHAIYHKFKFIVLCVFYLFLLNISTLIIISIIPALNVITLC